MRIKKTATAKHEATLSPFLRNFITTATSIPVHELLPYLSTFPAQWPFPRGDLYHWIPLLNRFDALLEEQVAKYKLKDGPQITPWEETDETLVKGILAFSRILVENCGNRSLYASSGHINDLLNTTSLDILEASLRLGARLAQRYHTSRSRASHSTSAALLASHYSINLDRVSKLASPFLKSVGIANATGGKHVTTKAVVPVYAHDIARLAKDEKPADPADVGGSNSGKGRGKGLEHKEGSWEEWGGAWITYYVSPTAQKTASVPGPSATIIPKEPTTPTPNRRSSMHHTHTHSSYAQHTTGSAHQRRKSADEALADFSDPSISGGMQTLEIPHHKIEAASNLEEILADTLHDLPSDTHYDILHRLRVASALNGTVKSRRQILGIRILALTNLAYVYSETQFLTKILAPDQDEPRRLQLVYQLAELVHSGDAKHGSVKGTEIPRWLQTLALGGLEALARHKAKTADVCAALSINVNHGVLLYVVRKAVAELAEKDNEYDQEIEEWRDALFSLVGYLPSTTHAGSLLVSAGLIPILVELLQFRSKNALRNIARALSLLDQLIYNVQNAFQALANARGLDVVVELVSDHVKEGLREVEEGKGIPEEYKSQQTDFQIGYYRQQTLKIVFKFIQHMMAQSGGNADRLLRNLIDSPKLLAALKIIIENGGVWGSHVWSTVVGMVSAFIHNEPTSYNVIHEAGLSHSLLESVTGKRGLAEEEVKSSKDKDQPGTIGETSVATTIAGEDQDKMDEESAEDGGAGPSEGTKAKDEKIKEVNEGLPPRLHSPAACIMPSADAIGSIPTAFGAMCLNSAGLALFQASGALETFFEIFESPEHVKNLTDNELGGLLGSQFDELVRHHPDLREGVMKATIEMVTRVGQLGKKFAEEKGMGAKVWIEDGHGGIVVAGGRKALIGIGSKDRMIKTTETPGGTSAQALRDSEDIEMSDVDTIHPTITLGSTNQDGSPLGEVVTLADVCDEETDDAQPSIDDFIDVAAKFLEGFLANLSQTKDFIKRDGLERLLDYYTLPSLPYDFATSQANHTLCRVMSICSEHCPPVTITAILHRSHKAVDQLQPLLTHSRKEAFFAPLTNRTASALPTRLHGVVPSNDDRGELNLVGDMFVDDSHAKSEIQMTENIRANGTKLVKDLVTLHSLSFLLQDLYTQPLFNVRQTLPLFQAISKNAGEYESLIPSLGALHRMCVWEEILLQNSIPETWNEATRVKDSTTISTTNIEDEALTQAVGAVAAAGISVSSGIQASKSRDDQKEAEKAVVERDGKTSWFRNVKTIRCLISQIPLSITRFLQGLARCLVSRRAGDLLTKQHAFKIAESIADLMYYHLTWKRLDTSDSVTEKYKYWIVMLTSMASLLLEGGKFDLTSLLPSQTDFRLERPNVQVITTTLITFKQNNGIKTVVDILGTFWKEVQTLPSGDPEQIAKDQQRMAHAYGGIKIILSMFTHLVYTKAVLESPQTQALQSRERASERDRPDYFNPHQFLVELRASILPIVREMWEASSIDKASCSIVKSIVEILGVILKADGEAGAFTRKDLEKKPGLTNTISWRTMEPNEERIRPLVDMGFPREAALLALLRCSGNVDNATEWLISHGGRDQRGSQHSAASSRPRTADSHSTEDEGTDVEPSRDGSEATPSETPAQSTIPQDELVAPPISAIQVSEPQTPAELSSADKGKGKEGERAQANVITIEDLDAIRTSTRDNLITRSLDVLQVHTDVTFELSKLITNAFVKGSESIELRKEAGSTIVQSLMSLQMDDDFRPQGKTISSTAHLLGIILHNQEFYEACFEDLKDQISVLVGFIKIYPGEPAPWIANILLVVEKILSESAQPVKTKFAAPGDAELFVEPTNYKIDDESQSSFFNAVMDIIPHIGKDEVLPLAVARVLVSLTRKRELAIRMAEKRNLAALFNMLRLQAGHSTERIQSCIMLILRHIIEDADTLKAIMKSDIRTWFHSKGSRQIDTQTFIRHNHHLVLRDPDVFVSVVNELCKLTRYDQHLRHQQITLKETEHSKGEVAPEPAKKSEEEPQSKEQKESEDKEMSDKPKHVPEVKPPGLDKPDGVIHFLISELLALKDIEDSIAPAAVSKEQPDVAMDNGGLASGTIEPTTDRLSSKPEKPEFKAEQHPTFIYRCFILQALTELLSCYNRSKIEFINFSRKAAPREAITPSKPRSAVLNYLLNDVIPLGTLIHTEDISYKKRATTSQWAILTVVSLSAQTGEVPSTEEEPNLLFVRKFILESALKAFKDASSSAEPLDSKYSRMMSLTDLFFRILSARPNSIATHNNISEKSQQQIARIMFEKNFIGALTSSLADIDLNFPSARRVIKYILRPLKLLSKTATELAETSSILTPGAIDEDEISTASSMSDIDDLREETPDLYRNSTLGMFEGGEMADDPSDFDEDEDDDEMYDEEIEFEEGMEDDGGSDISDEEEEEHDSGMDVSANTDSEIQGLSIDFEIQVEIVVEHAHHDHDDSDEDDEDDEDLSDDMDEDGDDVEVIDEMAEDHRGHFGSGEEDWQSDGEDDEEDEEDDDIITSDNPLETIVRALGVSGEAPEPVDEDRDEGDEDEEEDEDDDDMDEEEAMIQEDYDDDEGAFGAVPWSWADDAGEAPMMARHPRGPGGWYTLGGPPREPPVFMSGNPRPRHYIGSTHPRVTENSDQNPLLQPSGGEQGHQRPAPTRNQEFMTDWVQAIDGMHNSGPGGAVSMISTLMSLMTRSGHAVPVLSNGAIQFQPAVPHIHGHHHHHGFVPREIRSMFGVPRQQSDASRHHREDPQTAVNSFIPTLTTGRWAEESRLLFGVAAPEYALRVVNAILALLVPPAIEDERVRKEKEEAARKEALRLEEERKKEEEERIAREKAEAEEKAKKEAEEREAAEQAAAEAAAAASTQVEDEGDSKEESKDEDAMEGVETQGVTSEGQAGPSNPPAPRATVMIRGREMDITGMDIDPGFLEALPEDIREEVLTQHIRERRAAAASSDQPSEISPEFLEALPDEIRQELLEQELADRRRREREQARVRQTDGTGPVELDLASFLATLEPGLRQTVLLEQDDESLAQLPQAIAAEANALRGDRRLNQFVDIPRVARVSHIRQHDESKAMKKPIRKGTVQLLDKAGVATLLRLMFIPQVGSTRMTLHEILLSICENRQNRAEVVNVLLSILQDGSADMVAVERSFTQLSLRAKQTAVTKTPVQVAKRSNVGLLGQTSSEVSPLMVAQQCLNALLFLVNYNEHISSYFLTEHDISAGLKRSASRKGKGKEIIASKACKFALNTLLTLLDRRLITESTSVMDQLSVLLSEITRPLTILLKKDKRKPEEEKPVEQPESTEPIVTVDMSTDSNAAVVIPEGVSGAMEKSEEKKKDPQEDDKPKKQRTLVPPVVPEHNLRLVVNILTARECSSKTFRETLATMQNLSAIPEAKDVFGAELIRQAQELGRTILGHLDELVRHIKNAQSGTEVQGMALSNFSPASSDQAKLLRVLTALDYLFDPKRAIKDKGEKPDEKKKGDSKSENDILTNLYESLTFEPLWAKLSDCLFAIHERPEMLHVATILLPLIEALMVVCKNSGLKEATPRQQRSQTPKSPPANTGMETLFFRFTEDHRKILNQMVRNNPKLMSGSFSLLVNNPKVLEFDNKRNYFNRRLHSRSGNRDPHPTLQLNVRRDQVFLDSYKSMYYKTGDEIKYAKLSIRFHGEEGVDAGGVTREWFQVMARQMFNPGYALFIPVASDRTTFHPNRMSGINPEHLSFFKFIGRIIGKALYEGRVLDCHFSRAVYKRILGKSVSLKDMETLDLDYYKSLVWMLENDITDIITETFSIEADDFGDKKTIDLIPNGRNEPVTEENKHDYVRLLVEYRLLTSVQEQMEHFLIGFHDIVPAELISIFNEQELELLISGLPEIDVDDWRNNTEYYNYSASSPQIQWFWRAVRSFDKEERAKLLQFVTGTSKVPLNGFKELEGMNGFSKFNIHRDYGSKDRLPSSHTCFNQLDLPEYDSYEALRKLLLTAITQGAEYFGFA
ncbi:E3 ubiquitin-protein ligase tom1 [Rhizina undulata]